MAIRMGTATTILLPQTSPPGGSRPGRRRRQRARIGKARHGRASIDDLLDIRGFNLDAILEIEPDFLTDVEHEHDDVTSFVFREKRPLDLDRIEESLGSVVQVYGPNLMRYKGVLDIRGIDRRVVFQGVHMLMGSDVGAAWKPNEPRESKFVFIGRDMPREVLLDGLAQCVAAPSPAPNEKRPRHDA